MYVHTCDPSVQDQQDHQQRNPGHNHRSFERMFLKTVILFFLITVALTDSAGKQKDKRVDLRSVLKPGPNDVAKIKLKHKDCHDWGQAGAKTSGVHIIYPNGTYPVKVHCEHGVNASYTVIQRRVDGNINFHTTWPYYKAGFGHAQGDYWAGLDVIHQLTINGNNKLRVNVQNWAGKSQTASYSKFLVMDESNHYKLYVSGKSGTLPDDLSYHNGMDFATPDRPDPNQCAVKQRAGWWFNYCAYTLPNGIYYYNGHYNPNTAGFYDGIYWKDWEGYAYSMKFISLSVYK